MKIIKFLQSNFQVFNFFVAFILIVVIFVILGKSNTSTTTSSNKSKTPVEKEVLLQKENMNNVQPNRLDTPNLTTQASIPEKQSQKINTDDKKIEEKDLLPQFPKNDYTPPKKVTVPQHLPYEEAPQNRLINAGKYYHRTENLLDQEAFQAFQKMKNSAKAQGVNLIIISGFRSIASQEKLFNKQIQKRGSVEAAAVFSAPPGHSEHHTGYAIDIGDGKQPDSDLKIIFQNTNAYNWLTQNAHIYGFELSFPEGNRQGVNFEPWHWRYIGSARSQQIFFNKNNF